MEEKGEEVKITYEEAKNKIRELIDSEDWLELKDYLQQSQLETLIDQNI